MKVSEAVQHIILIMNSDTVSLMYLEVAEVKVALRLEPSIVEAVRLAVEATILEEVLTNPAVVLTRLVVEVISLEAEASKMEGHTREAAAVTLILRSQVGTL